MVLLLLIVLLTYSYHPYQPDMTSFLPFSSPIQKQPLTAPVITELLKSSETLSFLSLHPNLFILLVLLITSTLYTLTNKALKNPSTVPMILSSATNTQLSTFTSPETCASSSDCPSFPSLNISFLEHYLDNGNFFRSFEILSTTSTSSSQQSFRAKHKLDSFCYIVKVERFEGTVAEEKVELAVLERVGMYKSIKCDGIVRYVTCWVEEIDGQVALYVQMEAIEGVSVAEFLKSGVYEREAGRIVKKTEKVLRIIHRRGMAHGNVSVENVFVDKFGKVVIGEGVFGEDIEKDLNDFARFRVKVMRAASGKENKADRIETGNE